jgi:hypothetical protein
MSGIAASPKPELAEIPDWLRDFTPQLATQSGTADPAELRADAEPPPVGQPEVGTESPAPILSAADVRGDEQWLAALQAGLEAPSAPLGPDVETAGPLALPELKPGLPETEKLAQAQIPDWLEALRPAAEAGSPAGEEESLETEGVLEGLRGVLPRGLAAGATASAGQGQSAGNSVASLARAQLLQSLVTQPRSVAKQGVPRRRAPVGGRVERWIVAIVLVGAVVGSFVAPLLLPDVPTLVALPRAIPAADGLYAAIERLSPGDAVMLAFEYGPEQADELDLVARPIVRHVLDQEGRASVVSTRPDGLAVAARLFGGLTPDSEVDQYAMTYVPGEVAGVAQLVSSQPDLIVVLAGKPGPLRWWVEQTRAVANPPPIVAGTSAALEPTTSPYLDPSAGQLMGAVSGLAGAVYYEKKAQGTVEGWATERLNTLAVGQGAIVVLMVLGAILHATGLLPGRGK